MPPALKTFLQRWTITTVAVLVAAYIVPGIRFDSPVALVLATLVLGILNVVVRPLLMIISLPVLIFTLGLFTLVINGFLLYWVGRLIHGFHVDSFGDAFWGALVISLITLFLNGLVKPRDPPKPPPPVQSPPGNQAGGPIIDV